MLKRNSENMRIKRDYRRYCKGPGRLSDTTIDKRFASLTFFEKATGYKDFKKHNLNWPEKVLEALHDARNASGDPLSASTKSAYLRDIRDFVRWLSDKPGYKSKISYRDADYYQLPMRDEAIAKAKRDPVYPTLDQTLKAFHAMPAGTPIETRDKASFGLLIMTGARVNAMTTFKFKHVDLDKRTILQDARDVHTKFGKTFLTVCYVSDPAVWEAFAAWVRYLYEECNFGPNDPLFPKSNRVMNDAGVFASDDITREHWAQTGSQRHTVKNAFQSVHMPAYGPHSFRHMLTHVGMEICKTPHDMKAWSQNFGHSNSLVTFANYGQLTNEQQIDVIENLSKS